MEDIQAENGHVDIANSIVEALCMVQLSGYESRVLWALFRKTYGWHKKEDRISLSQFQALTGLPIPKISNTLNRLVLRKMVSVTENGNGKVKSYGFQKVYSLWQDLPEKVIPKMGIPEKGITENGSKGLPKSASTKETITKEKRPMSAFEIERRDFFEELWKVYPRKIGKPSAFKHYLKTVKTDADIDRINDALAVYLKEVKNDDPRFIKHGSTWFNNWQDWEPQNER